MSVLFPRLREIFNIRANESRMAGLVIGVMLLTSAGFTLGSTAIDALFFTRFGVEYLPYMYRVLGVLSFAASLGITAILGRFKRERTYILTPLILAILIFLAWGILFSEARVIYPALWLGKEVVNALITLMVWGLAGSVCDPRQSKRLFPLFNAGRIFGAVLAGLVTGMLVKFVGTQNLLLAWALALILSAFISRVLIGRYVHADPVPNRSRHKPKPSFIQEMKRGYQFVSGLTLMRWVSLSAILFSILYFSIALPFSKSATAQFPDEDSLASFLGLFNGFATAAAFVTSIFIANRLYSYFGIMKAILGLPVIYLIGFCGLAVSNTFLVILLFRFIQMLWLSGIADSAYQAIFNAVPSARRDQVRAFIDGVPAQAGTMIAGLILIVGEQAFSSRQLAVVGLVTSGVTIYVIFRANLAYNKALADSLRAGRPTLFVQDDRLGLQLDGAALRVTLDGMHSPDPVIRRVSAEILAGVEVPAATDALITGLQDEDTDVRYLSLKGLARPQAVPALIDIAEKLHDPQPAVRAQAVDTLRSLTPYPHGLRAQLTPLLVDSDTRVRVRTAIALLNLDDSNEARNLLHKLAKLGNTDERIIALKALAEVRDPEVLALAATELSAMGLSPAVRSASAEILGLYGAPAIPALQSSLATEDPLVLASIASALGKIGESALPAVLESLSEPASEEGALKALEQLPSWKESRRVRDYARERIATAVQFEEMRQAIPPAGNERLNLLNESLTVRARRDGVFALRSLSMLRDREAMVVAIDNLQSKDTNQRATALETLDAVHEAALIRPLLHLWEPEENRKPAMDLRQVIQRLVTERDPWLRACCVFAAPTLQDLPIRQALEKCAQEDPDPFVRQVAAESLSMDMPMDTLTTLSIMERVLLLRHVPLLADLTPADLQRVAAIATEYLFSDGDIVFEQGDPGDEMYVIVSGEVRVLVVLENRGEKEIARRVAGDVVGEMSIISGDARSASVAAVGDVRMLCLDRLGFESLLRERPEVSLAVLREICARLKQSM
jgi:HEAT repeat protein